MLQQQMQLKIFVDPQYPELKATYLQSAEMHNKKMADSFYDSGFDLPLPHFISFIPNETTKVDFGIKCRAQMVWNSISIISDTKKITNSPFYLYARSSISKTPLRLANNQGIIDSGYRGSIIGMFDALPMDTFHRTSDKYYIEAGTRLVQICAPNLCPIEVTIVDTLEELGEQTARGEGGFGSTNDQR
jgi:dUTP pyrophosphatase